MLDLSPTILRPRCHSKTTGVVIEWTSPSVCLLIYVYNYTKGKQVAGLGLVFIQPSVKISMSLEEDTGLNNSSTVRGSIYYTYVQ